MKSLPFVETFYGPRGCISQAYPSNKQISCNKHLRGCPAQLADFVQQTLRWHPEERPTAASASLHSFVGSLPLSVTVAVANGKNGLGSILQGDLDEELLEYLQQCPSWEQLHAECGQHGFKPSKSMSQEEGALGKKTEFVGYIDRKNPPMCNSLNGDRNLKLVRSERLASFAKALRRAAQTWLHQLTARVRAEIRRQNLPSEFLKANGSVFMEEDLADNAFVYASPQVMAIGEREDGWHTDGGTSLLHGALTLFGSRNLLVKREDADCISLPQRPGSFYVGNMCALEHNVAHDESAVGCYGQGPSSEQVKIAVMLRSDVFRGARARKINAVPGPGELFRIVNNETARHLAEQPFHLPDLAAVIAESRLLLYEESP